MVQIDGFLSAILSALHLRPSVTATGCSLDNCLGAMMTAHVSGRLQSAQSSCATHTKSLVTTTESIPEFAVTSCVGDIVSRVSSACSCVTDPSVTTVSVISPSTTTITMCSEAAFSNVHDPISKSSEFSATAEMVTSVVDNPSATSSFVESLILTSIISMSASESSRSTTKSTSESPATKSSEPCAILSSLAAAQTTLDPYSPPIVDAKLAYDCLDSVPLDREAAITFVESIVPYLAFQSDLNYKKDPPTGYYYPPVDVLDLLAKVVSDLKDDKFPNEYAFQKALFEPVAKAHDGHLSFYPDLLTEAVAFARNVALVSFSNGVIGDSPEIYFQSDINSCKASPVEQIDGIDAATFVQQWADTASLFQDADASFNSMFASLAWTAAGASDGGYFYGSSGRMRFIYPGQNTTYSFQNGTELTIPNIAYVTGNFSGVVDGSSFYKIFCAPGATDNGFYIDPPERTSIARVTKRELQVSGYPEAIVASNDPYTPQVNCYFLSGAAFSEVAVLSILTFNVYDTSEFQSVIQDCIATSQAAGRTKMIIDLQANGGGSVGLGFDTFRQFYPDIVQDGISRNAENDIFLTVARLVGEHLPLDYDPTTASNADNEEYYSPFNYRYAVNLTEKNFLSFNDAFDPHVYNGQAYTALYRNNFSDPFNTINEEFGVGIEITGYGNRTSFKQPFKTTDLVLLYDGSCSSACTQFSEGMRVQGGVKSVAFGGRPGRSKIQGVGGVKGVLEMNWAALYQTTRAVIRDLATSPEDIATLSKLTLLPLTRLASATLNFADGISRYHVEDGLPSQYVVDEADCRLFWTKLMMTDVTEIWKAAANAAFNGGGCVAGSLP